MKAPVYREENTLPSSIETLISQAQEQLNDLRANCRATVPITRSGSRVGYGIRQVEKNMSADLLIVTIRSIKSAAKGW